MAQSDIYLRNERVTAVGALEVATGRDADADVRVFPDSAVVEVGGGPRGRRAGSSRRYRWWSS